MSPELLAVLGAVLGGGGLAALLQARSVHHKTMAEASATTTEADVSATERLVAVATSLLTPLNEQLARQEEQIVALRVEVAKLKQHLADVHHENERLKAKLPKRVVAEVEQEPTPLPTTPEDFT